MTLRTGRKVGRTLYWQEGAEPSDDDRIVGLMDDRVLAAEVVRRWHAAARYEGCCAHAPAEHDRHGCTVDVSTDRRTYERCHL